MDTGKMVAETLEGLDDGFTTYQVRMAMKAEYGDHPKETKLNTALGVLVYDGMVDSERELEQILDPETNGENISWYKEDSYDRAEAERALDFGL